MTCSKLYVTKIKYSKSLQSQRTKYKIKTNFDFAVILCMCSKTEFNPPSTPSLATRHRRVTKNYILKVFVNSFSFLLWFIALYYLLL